jgi:serine/threonine-protein kinase
VALKVLTERVARDAESRRRFLREARIAAAIKHPNVVNIFDVGVHQGIPYLVMELLEGQDLESLLSLKGPLDQRTIIDVMIPVVAALAAVHDAGIVHRDLKPGNIFLARGRGDELEPKVLDFGISKAIGPDQFKLTLANGPLLGTPFYVPPEAVHGHEVTALSDQYSLGVLMYECATGATPFEAQTPAEVLRLISSGEHVRAAERRPELSSGLTAIIERAMSLSPQDRFPNMRQLGRDLLFLAGQRTRITWGLSFGFEVETAANARTGSIGLSRKTSSSRIAATWRWPLGWKRAALVVGAASGLVFMAAAGVFSFKRKAPQVAAASATVDVQPPQPASAPPPAPSMAEEQSAPQQVAYQVEEKPSKAPAKPTSKPRSANKAPRAPKPGELARRVVAPAVSPAPSKVTAQPAPSEAESTIGTNGAPILD